ncbi:ribonuclease H-like domain-containing protein [Tanacetum coccineum]
MFKFSPAIREHVDIGEENTRVSAQEWSKGDREKGSYGLKDLDAYSIGTTHRNDALPRKKKDPGSFTLPCYINNVCFEKALTDLGASISVMPLSTCLNLGLGELGHTKLTVELADRMVKQHKWNWAENYSRDWKSLRERMDLDLEARLMGETLILNRSFDPLYGDYIELNYLNDPLERRRNKVDDLGPTVEENEVVNEPVMDIVKTSCMTQLMDASGRTYQAFDNTLVGISQIPYQRRTRQRTGEASTSGFAAVLAVLVTEASQSRQHGKSESDSYYLSD